MSMLTVMSIFAFACRVATAQDDPKHSTPVLKSKIEYAVVGSKSLRLDAHLPESKVPVLRIDCDRFTKSWCRCCPTALRERRTHTAP
jgi:hypothetical protein